MLRFWTDLVEVGVMIGRPAGGFFIIPSTHPHLRVARQFNWQLEIKLLFVRAFSAFVLRLANRNQSFHLLLFWTWASANMSADDHPSRTHWPRSKKEANDTVWWSFCHHTRLPRRRVDRLSPSRSTFRPSSPPQDPLPKLPALRLRNLKSLKQGWA